MTRRIRLETHSIDFIPLSARHGKASDLFFLWFGANAQMAVVTTGILTIYPHFAFFWAAVGIVAGSLLGSVFMAYHSAQGPHLGIPQMIQSRAQFGYYGAVIPLVMVVAMYFGFYAAGAVIGADALSLLFHVPVHVGIFICAAADLILVLGGYTFIHRFNRVMAYFFTAVFAVVTGLLIWGPGLGRGLHHAAVHGQFMTGPFLLAISLAVINTLGYAPYVADYSRYLPAKTTIGTTFWYSYIGVVLSNIWMMLLGALVQTESPHTDPVRGFFHLGLHVSPIMAIAVLLAAWLGIISINALNIYGAFMSTLTIVSTFYRRWKPTLSLRVKFIIPITIVATYVSFFDKSALLASFETFLTLLIDFLVPWTAINLTDYYLVRHGTYDIQDIFRPNGRYGQVNVNAFAAYIIGFVAEIPFMHNAYFEGPVSRFLHNGDISWMVGIVAAGFIYWMTTKFRTHAPAGGGDLRQIQGRLQRTRT